jgi:hypothetical protein
MANDMDRVYQSVDAAWPNGRDKLPPLEQQEAISAVKHLWRVGTGVPVSNRRSYLWRRKFKITPGRRYTGIRGGVYCVNPDRGWWHLVHDVSHSIHLDLLYATQPGKRPHDATQAYLERRLIDHVVSHGWLDGKLRRDRKPKPNRNIQDVRHERVIARIKLWRTKQRRVETALKKLAKQKAYYESQQQRKNREKVHGKDSESATDRPSP